MALGSDGTVFVGTRAQTMHAVVNRNKDFKADEVLTVATGLTYAERARVQGWRALRRREQPDLALRRRARLRQGRRRRRGPEQTVLADKLPPDRMHGWKYLTFGPDGLLYSAIGAPCNILDRAIPSRRSSA